MPRMRFSIAVLLTVLPIAVNSLPISRNGAGFVTSSLLGTPGDPKSSAPFLVDTAGVLVPRADPGGVASNSPGGGSGNAFKTASNDIREAIKPFMAEAIDTSNNPKLAAILHSSEVASKPPSPNAALASINPSGDSTVASNTKGDGPNANGALMPSTAHTPGDVSGNTPTATSPPGPLPFSAAELREAIRPFVAEAVDTKHNPKLEAMLSSPEPEIASKPPSPSGSPASVNPSSGPTDASNSKGVPALVNLNGPDASTQSKGAPVPEATFRGNTAFPNTVPGTANANFVPTPSAPFGVPTVPNSIPVYVYSSANYAVVDTTSTSSGVVVNSYKGGAGANFNGAVTPAAYNVPITPYLGGNVAYSGAFNAATSPRIIAFAPASVYGAQTYPNYVTTPTYSYAIPPSNAVGATVPVNPKLPIDPNATAVQNPNAPTTSAPPNGDDKVGDFAKAAASKSLEIAGKVGSAVVEQQTKNFEHAASDSINQNIDGAVDKIEDVGKDAATAFGNEFHKRARERD